MVHKPKKFSLPIFPIPMGIFNYGKDNHNLNKGLVDDILTEVEKDSEGKVRSNFGGWHSQDGLENRYDSFKELQSIITFCANEYCKSNGFKEGLISYDLWANINEAGDMNAGHHHGSTALAGVYYPAESIIDDKISFNYTDKNPIRHGIWDGKNGGSLYFQDPCYGLKNSLAKKDSRTPYTIDCYHTYPVASMLILFPSYLIHTVTPFKETKKRISISFACNYERH
mgnify:CR=1 FL=1